LNLDVQQLNRFLVLHPRHKLKYFERAGWEADWITAAEEIVRAEFEHSYASSPVKPANIEVLLPAHDKKKVRRTCTYQHGRSNLLIPEIQHL
jgi:hypothetical protein